MSGWPLSVGRFCVRKIWFRQAESPVSHTSRLLRDAIVNPVWEGAANIQSLEVLKSLGKTEGKGFLKRIRHTLDQLTHEQVLLLKDKRTEKVDELEKSIQHTLRQDRYTQEGLAKKLAYYCYDVFAAVQLLEEAQYDLISSNSNRRVAVADYWFQMTFDSTQEKGILGNHVVSNALFNRIMGEWYKGM